MTTIQLSKMFNIPLRTIQHAITDGRINAQKFGRDYFVQEDELLEQFLNKYKTRRKEVEDKK